MSGTRLIARLDIKGPNLIKGIQFEGLRVVGDPYEFATRYYREGIDEIVYIDTVASLYGRNNIVEVVKRTARDVFIPMTVGGGIRSVADATELLRAGADKVAINTAAVERPNLIAEVADRFGSQCMVLSIEAKRAMGLRDSWEVYTNNGREHSGRDVVDWVREAVELGAGEVLLTSVDQDGTRDGFDVELVRAVTAVVNVPVVASGGMGNFSHLVEVVNQGGASGVAIGELLHRNRMSIDQIRSEARSHGVAVRGRV